MNRAIRVLVADDDTEVRGALSDLLRVSGFDVVAEARNGEAAVDLSRRLAPEVVLLDLKMPVLDGAEAAKQLVGHDDMQVVILSAYDNDRLRRDAMRAGARAFLVKGAPPTDIIEALTSAGRAARRGAALKRTSPGR